MAGPEQGFSAQEFFRNYRSEILHWNASMNLISRRDPPTICDGLLEQCQAAFGLFWAWLAAEGLVADGEEPLYVDLGSGAGLPGVVWSQMLREHGTGPRAVLVEPREKRAWFLERVAKLKNAPPFDVVRGRWGEVRHDGPSVLPVRTAIMSLKALFMNDLQVLEGLAAYVSGSTDLAGGFHDFVIVRFYPPDQKLDAPLLDDLGPSLSEFSGAGLLRSLELRSRCILGPTKGLLPASLVLTHYATP